ncbi:MAG: phosphate starvation-inducible protein PhoH, partial [Roseovarius sp.]|nr:phosphate starvation-inducible protein PhoH [Roseovarius sp.]
MATTALPPIDDASSLHEECVEFPDNFLLIDLCGEHDRNLAEIERQLGVQILRRGNRLAVVGEPAMAAEAVAALRALY